ncbi:MAG TPA: HIT family protein [Pseudomonadales bacterium]|nr:HIT family protein [Pseudomonadales bacterium]
MNAPVFILSAQLQKDCIVVGNLKLCQVLLLNDANFIWLVLVPRRHDIREIFELNNADQQQLLAESSFVGRLITENFPCDKLNIAALGNIVPQLHVHHIARRKNDPCWPGVVWGYGQGRAYQDQEKTDILRQLQKALSAHSDFSPAAGTP